MEVEYTLCQIQSGQVSLAAKTHRQSHGDPRLVVRGTSQAVRWELTNLVDGDPETIVGVPRQDHVDFYFLLDVLRRDRGQLPQPTVRPDYGLRLDPANPAGMERPGGRQVRLVAPAYRYRVDSVEVFVTQAPSFHAIGSESYLHLDIESTPSRMYGQEVLEVHFGIQADFEIVGQFTGAQSRAVIEMTPETYATIFEEIRFL